MGYFLLTVVWLLGVWLNLKKGIPNSFAGSLLVSSISYFLLVLVLVYGVPHPVLLPIYALLILGMATPAGALFRTQSGKQSTWRLFFHENNGFVLGFILSLLGFVHWGVQSPFYLPLFSLLLILCLYFFKSIRYPLMIVVSGILGLAFFQTFDIAVLFVVFAASILASGYSSLTKPSNEAGSYSPSNRIIQSKAILFLSGVNLIILQFFITREFSTLFAATELSILIVASAYFTGYSVGYFVTRKIPETWLWPLSWVILFLHLDIFIYLRFFSGLLVYLGAGWWALIIILFLTSFFTSAFYSLFLPRLTSDTLGKLKITTTYAWELAGSVVGILLLLIIVWTGGRWIQSLYFFVLFSILLLIQPSWRMRRLTIVAAIGLLSFLMIKGSKLELTDTQDYYTFRGYSNPEIRFQSNSFYHTIDILDTHPSVYQPSDGRWSFINGVLYFGYQSDSLGSFIQETGLSEFTYFLAEIPARYQSLMKNRKLKTLILGCGSMYSIGRVAPYSDHIDLVEIDPEVIRSAKTCWIDLNHWDQFPQVNIVIDDAKHYIRTHPDKYDLIIMDISAPYTLGTLLLHNQDFFHMLKDHLTPGGLFSESTQGTADPDFPNSQGMKILAGVIKEYPETLVLNTHGNSHGYHGFVYASCDSALQKSRFDSILKTDEMNSGVQLNTNWDELINWSNVQPFSYRHMETLLSGNIWRLSDRLNLDKKLVDLSWMHRRWSRLPQLGLRLPGTIRQILLSGPFWIWIGFLVIAGVFPLSRSRNKS